MLLLVGQQVYQAGTQAGLQQKQMASSASSMTLLTQELAASKRQLLTMEQQLTVERSAKDALARQLEQLEADSVAVREQLAFYESLLTTTDRAPALSVAGFSSEPLGSGRYRLRLLLVQGQSGAQLRQLELEFRLSYLHDGKRKQMSWPVPRIVLNMERYARYAGELSLPDGAKLQQLELNVLPKGGGKPLLQRQYEIKG